MKNYIVRFSRVLNFLILAWSFFGFCSAFASNTVKENIDRKSENLSISGNDIWLNAGNTQRLHFRNEKGWYLESAEILSNNEWVKTFKPNNLFGINRCERGKASGPDTENKLDIQQIFDGKHHKSGRIKSLPAWLTYEFADNKAFLIDEYTISVPQDNLPSKGTPSSWILKGSNDGINWEVLDRKTSEEFAVASRNYTIQNPKSYRYFKFDEMKGTGSSLEIADIKLLDHSGSSNHGFFIGDTAASSFTDESDANNSKIVFHGTGWSTAFWVSNEDELPWVHVKTSGAQGKTMSFKTMAEGQEDGACYVGWSSYNKDAVVNGSWQAHHSGYPVIVGHSVVNSNDYGYLVYAENTVFNAQDSTGPYNSHSQLQVTHGCCGMQQNQFGYWALKYDKGYEQEYKMIFTHGNVKTKTGTLKISGILKKYLAPIIQEVAGNDQLDKRNLYPKREKELIALYKDPDIYVENEGYSPMECEYDNADGTFARGVEFGSTQLIIPTFLYSGYAQKNNDLINFFTGRAYEENRFQYFVHPGKDLDPNKPRNLSAAAPFTWFIQHDEAEPFYYQLTGDYEEHFLPFSQWCSYMKSAPAPDEQFIKDDFSVGNQRGFKQKRVSYWSDEKQNATHSSAVAWNLLLQYKVSGDESMKIMAFNMLDQFINPHINGDVEDLQDEFQSAPSTFGMCPEGVFLAAMANVEAFLISQDCSYLKCAEEFVYCGINMYSILPFVDPKAKPHSWWFDYWDNTTWQYSQGMSTGSEKDEIHGMTGIEIDAAKPGAYLAWLSQFVNVPSAYPMLNIFEKNHDAIFNPYGTVADGKYGIYTKECVYYESMAFHYINEVSDSSLLLVYPDAGVLDLSVRTKRNLSLYNPTNYSSSPSVYMKNLNEGTYKVSLDGTLLGTFSELDLQTKGIIVRIDPKQVRKIIAEPDSKPIAKGTGLKAEYFSSTNLSPDSLLIEQVDSSLKLNSKISLVKDQFSVRWSGEVEAPVSGEYTFYTTSNSGVKLYIDDRLVVKRWMNTNAVIQDSGKVSLSEGIRYPIRMEYYNSEGKGNIQLSWKIPGIPNQIIQSKYLYPATLSEFNFNSDTTYLSDLKEDFYRQLNWRKAEGCDGKGHNDSIPNLNWQILKKDKNVNGKTLIMDGKKYKKGLGSHSESIIEYSLNKHYEYFSAEVGIDDEITDGQVNEFKIRSGVGFRVYGDGKLLYETATLEPASPTESIKVSVKGINKLELMVVNNGRTKLNGYADWADAKLSGYSHTKK